MVQADDQLVSSYRASRVLGRDRQTIERAVRHLVPDTYTGSGKPRWRLSRIATVLAIPPQQRRESGRMRDRYRIAHREVDGLLATFEAQVAAIGAETSPARKRELALALAPLLAGFQELYLATGRALHVAEDDVLGARADLIWGEMMDEVSEAAEWPRGEGFFVKMAEVMWPEEGEAA